MILPSPQKIHIEAEGFVFVNEDGHLMEADCGFKTQYVVGVKVIERASKYEVVFIYAKKRTRRP